MLSRIVGVLLGWSLLNWLMTSCFENQLFATLKYEERKRFCYFWCFIESNLSVRFLASLSSVVGLDNLRQPLNQSEEKLNIAPLYRSLFRRLGRVLPVALISLGLPMIFSFSWQDVPFGYLNTFKIQPRSLSFRGNASQRVILGPQNWYYLPALHFTRIRLYIISI